MLLWRVGTNSLPTRDNLLIRMEVVNPCCILCNQELESACYLFFSYPAARAIWFASCWGYRSDQNPLNSHSNIINLILNPPEALCQAQDQWFVSLTMALIINEIWSTRNAVLHETSSVDLHRSIQSILIRSREFSLTLSTPKPPILVLPARSWTPPPPGVIKINSNAAISPSGATLVVVARDSQGLILKA